MQHFPKGMRAATLVERKRFYDKAFNVSEALNWLGERGPTVFAMIVGRHTEVYPEEYKKIRKNVVLVDEYNGSDDLLEYLLQYLPEGFYYDRNLYASLDACERCGRSYKDCWNCEGFLGQELAFDLDPENVACPWHGDIEAKMARQQGLSFCMHEFNEVKKQTLGLWEELDARYSKLKLVYSGRGFHIHVFDEDASTMTREERRGLAEELSSRFAIDEWVTSGEMRLIRMPYSLNGLVSRVCIPLEIEELAGFNLKDARCMPIFLAD